MGTTSEFRKGNTRFAILKLFTGEVERNDKRRMDKDLQCERRNLGQR